jgi:hypothetical protein
MISDLSHLLKIIELPKINVYAVEFAKEVV